MVSTIRRVLISVSDKQGVLELAKFLIQLNPAVEILSTGGTAKFLREADGGVLSASIIEMSDYTGQREILGGRVKSLHPKIHAGLLALKGDAIHEAEMTAAEFHHIDLLVCNLYPFSKTVASKEASFEECIEQIDIGGPAMIRSASKNFACVVCVTDPSQYQSLMTVLRSSRGTTTIGFRQSLAAAAFATIARYDADISSFFANQFNERSKEEEGEREEQKVATIVQLPPAASSSSSESSEAVKMHQQRNYQLSHMLKYGCNPHQKPAAIYQIEGRPLPFKIINGCPGYINLLDAINAFQLVCELKSAFPNLPGAVSFKHCSPAGCALGLPLTDAEAAAFEITTQAAEAMSPTALAYLRARNADPMSSFGDFVAINGIVDHMAAQFIKTSVCDGIIAEGFEPEALVILKSKKHGQFIILQGDEKALAVAEDDVEFREVGGVAFSQRRNNARFTAAAHLSNVVVGSESLPSDAVRDLVLASIAVKYTQSNSIGIAMNGQLIGIGAGQQVSKQT